MSDINIIYKEIEQLSQKSTISGTEKIVVSDTEFVTPSQIAGLVNVSGKQDTLVSGVNIKTINNLSILGSGNLNIEGGGGGGGTVEWGNIGGTLADQDDLATALATKADDSDIPIISTDIENDKNSNTKTASPKAVHDITGSLADLNTTTKSSLVAAINEAAQTGGGGDGNPVVDITVPTPYDGSVNFIFANGDVVSLDLNHSHPSYPKYQYCATQAAYDAITIKESDTLYVIPETSN